MRELIIVAVLGLGLGLTACSEPDVDVAAGCVAYPSAHSPLREPEIASTGPWELVDEKSIVFITTVKNQTGNENHIFDGVVALTGHVGTEGKAIVQIVLDGVDGKVDVRNMRMRQHLFETNKYPFVTVTADINFSDFEDMDCVSLRNKMIDMHIDMHGVKFTKKINVRVYRMGENLLEISPIGPLSIHAKDFGMERGVEKLRQLAKLDYINPEVKVSFELTFER